MMKQEFNILSEKSQEKLIESFNLRDEDAYAYVYTLYYDNLYYFASNLYGGTEVDSSDLVHDIFLSLWENKKTDFCSLPHIKSYLFLSVRNRYRKYWEHKKHIDKYVLRAMNDDSYFISEMVEVEVISRLSMMIDILPTECAKVLKLYVEGMDIKEIAELLGKSSSTVYNQKNEAIAILKKKLPKEFYSLIITIGSVQNFV